VAFGNPKRRVVVTGLGIVCPIGNSVADAWANALAGKSGVARITRFNPEDEKVGVACHIAGEVRDFSVARHMDIFMHYGIAAGIQAFRDSGLVVTEANRDNIGVNVGSGIGGLPMIEDGHSTLLARGARRISPFFIPSSIINMVSGHLSIMFGLRGPNLACVTACATGNHCIGESARLIESHCRCATATRPPRAGRGISTATALCWAREPACWFSKNTNTPRRAAPESTAR
jgi:3-oxoacyl-[acyl-carrier-protein] synthase II